jgi:hypothetical protein
LRLSIWAALVVTLSSGVAHAAGPWRGQIVDAETGLPLPGVVVLAEFIKSTGGLAGDSAATYYGSREVVTGSDGRFEIPGRVLWNPIRWRSRIQVEFVIFKPGYGPARFRGAGRVAERPWHELLAEEDVVIEMPPLKNREDRIHFVRSSARPRPWVTPPEAHPHYTEQLQRELRDLGL